MKSDSLLQEIQRDSSMIRSFNWGTYRLFIMSDDGFKKQRFVEGVGSTEFVVVGSNLSSKRIRQERPVGSLCCQ